MVFSSRTDVSAQNSIPLALGAEVSRPKGLSGKQKGAELFKNTAELFKSTAVFPRNPGESAPDSGEFFPGGQVPVAR
jgi:hypothetical protein